MNQRYNNINLIKRVRATLVLVFVFITSSCSSIKLIDSWKNPDYALYKPKKILVIGVTPNYEARQAFEFQLMTKLNARNIKALQSAVVFETSFKDSRQTEKEIEAQVDTLLSKDYDTVLVSLVKGVDNKESYGSESSKTDYQLRRFVLYYLVYQEAYYNQNYYNKYKVYNIETSIYNLTKEGDKSLVWQGSFDLVDPNNYSKTINSYVKKLIKTLEKEKIIPKKK